MTEMASNEKKKITRKFISNTSWQMAQQIYAMLVALVIGSISARYLGPSNYGLINYGTSLITIMTTLTALGLDEVVMNDLVANKKCRDEILGTAFLMRLAASVSGIAAIVLIVMALEPQNHLLWLITFLQSFQLIGNLYHIYNYWYLVELKSKYVSIAFIVGLTCASAWRISMLIHNASVEFFALTASIQSIIVLIIVAAFFHREAHLKLKWKKERAKDLISRSYHFIISGIAIMIYMQMDKVMIGKMLSEEQLGYYSAASMVANMWLFIPRSLINSARPIVLEGKKLRGSSGRDEYINRLAKLLFGMMALGVLVAAGFWIFGELAINIMYGEAYKEAIPVLSILIGAACLAQLGSVNGIWIASEGYNRWLKYTTWAGAIVNLILNYILIGQIGIVGAAIGTLLAQFSVQFVVPLFIPSLRKYFKVYGMALMEIKNVGQYIGFFKSLIKTRRG